MSYSGDHAGALADVKSAGALLTFVHTTLGTETPQGKFSLAPIIDRMLAYGTEDGGDPKEYEALGLTPMESPRLFVVCAIYGDVPRLGSHVTFGLGAPYTVKSVKPYRPDGLAIFSYVIISR